MPEMGEKTVCIHVKSIPGSARKGKAAKWIIDDVHQVCQQAVTTVILLI